MRFAALPYVYLLWCVPALVGLYIFAFVRRRRALGQFMDLRLAPRLLPEYSRLRQWGKAICLLGAVVCLVLGLMQPQWGKRWQEVPRRGRDLMILLDVSRSMLARDVIPNRLQRAKLDIKDLVHVLHKEGGHRLGLVVFAGRASLQCPLTSDYAFFLQKLNQVGPDTVGQGGTLIGDAIRKALQGLGTLAHNFKDIILITDGEDHDSFPLEAAKAAAAQRVSIYAIGLGDPRVGTRIPVDGDMAQEKFVQYQGQEVRSRMQEGLLLEIARLTGGAYVPAATRAIELDRIYAQYIAPKARREYDVTSRERYVHRFQWFVLGALLLMAIEGLIRERRAEGLSSLRLSSAICLLGGLLLIWPTVLWAASPYAAVHDGNALYRDAQYDKANARYATAEAALPDAPEIHFNRGNAFFKQGNYGEALKHYSQALQGASPELESRLKYNLGNVKYQEALQNLQTPQNAIPPLRAAMTYYRDSLDVDAQQHDARYNLELAHRLLKRLEHQQHQQQQQQKQQQQNKQQNKQQQQQKNQQAQEQQQHSQQHQQQQQQQDQQPSSSQQAEHDAASSTQEARAGNQDNSQAEQRTVQEMTPEEATRLLEAIREREREADEQRRQWHRARMQHNRVEKDW